VVARVAAALHAVRCFDATHTPFSQCTSVSHQSQNPQENVLAESAMMIPETRARLEAALSDLQGFVVRLLLRLVLLWSS